MRRVFLAVSLVLLSSAAVAAPSALISDLRRGGYVLVMRHAHAPGARPAAGEIAAGNTLGERQLDEEGRQTAGAMGAAIKALGVPIGQVFTSPTFRARQTVGFAGLAGAVPRPELGDGGASMAADASGAAGDAWLQARAREAPRPGTNTVIVTHGPNIGRAFDGLSVADGEAVVFRPDGRGGSAQAGRIRIEEWANR